MKPILNLAVAAGLSLLAAATSSAQSAKGNIRAVRVQGEVQMARSTGGPSIPIVEGAVMREKTEIRTGSDGRVILLFSNGSAASVRSGTNLVVERFVQDPFKGDPRSGNSEPTPSKVNMFLRNGSLLSSVKKLKPGSEYSVRNPLGAAGVRGTVTNYAYDSNSTSSATTTLKGLNVWTPDMEGSEPTPVGEGETLKATGKLGPDGKPIEYQQELVKTDESFIQELQQEENNMKEIIGNPEDPDFPNPFPPSPPPAPEGGTESGGPVNPTFFTSPP